MFTKNQFQNYVLQNSKRLLTLRIPVIEHKEQIGAFYNVVNVACIEDKELYVLHTIKNGQDLIYKTVHPTMKQWIKYCIGNPKTLPYTVEIGQRKGSQRAYIEMIAPFNPFIN